MKRNNLEPSAVKAKYKYNMFKLTFNDLKGKKENVIEKIRKELSSIEEKEQTCEVSWMNDDFKF